MFIVLLKFSDNKGRAGQFMEGHKKWIQRGLDDGVFLLVSSLQPNLGGGIIEKHHADINDPVMIPRCIFFRFAESAGLRSNPAGRHRVAVVHGAILQPPAPD